jgi:acetyl esterase/lipase
MVRVMETIATPTLPIPLPGRLGDPDMSLGTDPRADARLIEGMVPYGMQLNAPSPAVRPTSPYEERLAVTAAAESALQGFFPTLYADLSDVAGIERGVETIEGVDGNAITLYIHRPASTTHALPAILHLHGGGMALLAATDLQFVRWRDELAALGVIVVGVEFRNSGGSLGPHPFPAGLDDCTSALLWLHAHRDKLGVSAVVVSGESGGGNLTLATALRARRDGNLAAIDGVFAQCPYISGLYAEQPPELPSMRENDGYFLERWEMAVTASIYDPERRHAGDPLAWPYHAGRDDLTGLPPHVITVNELDPLRDEGIAYHHKLRAAAVSSACVVIVGTSHAAEVIFRSAIPDVYAAAARNLVGFAYSLAS